MEMEGLCIEGLSETNLSEVARNKAEIKRVCDDVGMTIISFLPIISNLVSVDPKKRQKALDLFDLSVEVADYFSSEFLYTDTFTPSLKYIGAGPYKESLNYGQEFKIEVDPDFDWQEQWDVLVESISRCNDKAKSAGKRMLVEPRLGENVGNTDAMLRLLDAVNNDNFGVLFDPAHLYPQKEILPLSLEKLGKKTYYVHLADSDGLTNEHLAIGAGKVDWDAIFAALKKHDFPGYFGIDIGQVPNLDWEYGKAIEFVRKMWRED
jgi:sugar phosphate isomerase/epimerase